MSSKTSRSRRRVPHLVVLSSVDPDQAGIKDILPPLDPPCSSPSDIDTSEDIPLRELLKAEVERESSPDLEFTRPLRHLFHPRSSSLPPIATAPLISTQTKRAKTISHKRILAEEQRSLAKAKEKQERLQQNIERDNFFKSIVVDMQEHEYTLIEFLDYLVKSRVTRETVVEWAINEVKKMAAAESAEITKSRIIQKSSKIIDEKFFLGFSLLDLTKQLRKLAPTIFNICDAFSTTPRQESSISTLWTRKRELMEGSAILTLLKAHSQNNSYPQAVYSTYLMATGAQRQHFSVLASLGISMGYTSIIHRPTNKGVIVEAEKKKKQRTLGTLYQLSEACRASARRVASSILFVTVYDNINMMVRVAEQIVGRKNAQENGTCATVIPLYGARLEDLSTEAYITGVMNAPPLKLSDLELTAAEAELLHEAMVYTILGILVKYGGEGFSRWKKDLDKNYPHSQEMIDVHLTPIHPLPAMEIDENSMTGNIEVVETIMSELRLDTQSPDFTKHVKIIAGDQLTIARQRSILNVRTGHEDGADAWNHIVLMPGLFHAKIADCHGLLQTHFGSPSICNPGNYLDEFHTWDTIRGHAEQILMLYANADRVQEIRESRLSEERKRKQMQKEMEKGKGKSKEKETAESEALSPVAPPHIGKGDMVFENACLFMRDALLSRLFSDAVKAGDSGLVVVVLKVWAVGYRGSGRSKYAHEMLHLLHNLINVWPERLRSVILQNWLINPTGRPNTFVEIDLAQEHLNFWIKKIYKADGDAHSWDWLGMVSPCVDVLRHLALRIHDELGSPQGSRHRAPDLENDIATLTESLQEHGVYEYKEGRVLDPRDSPVPDIISTGLAALSHGTSTTPLAEFNAQFDRLRERRKLTPISVLADTNTHVATTYAEAQLSETLTPQFELDKLDETADFVQWTGSESEAGSDPDENSFADSPTLTREDEDDVALDMDNWCLNMGDDELDDDMELNI